jgi:Mn-dependent DtxR family transcriptional regulator
MRDAKTQQVSWDAIVKEMNYTCSTDTVKRVIESMGYHKQVPHKKFDISQYKPKHVEWYLAHVNMTYEK